MKKIIIFALSVLGGTAFGSNPSEGFEWQKLDHSESKFYIPKFWDSKSDKKEVLDLYLFAPEVPKEGYDHETGFMVMIYKNFRANTGSFPSAVARDIESWVLDHRKSSLIESGAKDVGFFQGAIASHQHGGRRFQEIHLGNDEKDILWIIAFSAPVEDWGSSWEEVGFKIFSNLRIDDEY